MMKTIYFDCFSGISGDMCLGALIDAGMNPQTLQDELNKLNIDGYHLKWEKTSKHSIGATSVTVEIDDHSLVEHKHHHHHEHRNLKDITQIITASDLSTDIKEKSIQVFEHLATAEAKIHQPSIDNSLFHEVGAIDSIVDIVGTIIGLSQLGIEQVSASPLILGSGYVHCAHGVIPVPSPATLELLKDIPVCYGDVSHELVTPTGAALISYLSSSFGPMPTIRVTAIGYGAGKADLPIPNLLRVLIGES
jgi:hypothetical protein